MCSEPSWTACAETDPRIGRCLDTLKGGPLVWKGLDYEEGGPHALNALDARRRRCRSHWLRTCSRHVGDRATRRRLQDGRSSVQPRPAGAGERAQPIRRLPSGQRGREQRELREYGGGAAGRSRSDQPEHHRRRLPAGSLERRRGERPRCRTIDQRRRLVGPELGRVQRLLGRSAGVPACDRPVGQLRGGRTPVPDLAEHRLGRSRALGGACVHVDERRRDLERAGDHPARRESGQLQRQGVDHRRLDTRRHRLRRLDPRRDPG